jgi:hypothetical protein
MSEPRPLLTEDPTNPYARLLGSAELDVAPREGRARLLAGLGLQAATVLGTTTVAAAASGAGGVTAVAKWIAVGMISGFATTGSFHVLERRLSDNGGEAHVAPPAIRVPAANRGPEQLAPVVRSETATEQVSESRADRRETELPKRRIASPLPAARPESEPTPKAAATDTLAAEVAALDRARRALDERDPSRALSMLDAHAAGFGKPRLGPEATLLRIETLVAAGRREDARRLGQRLLSVDPATPHAERVRKILRDLASDR